MKTSSELTENTVSRSEGKGGQGKTIFKADCPQTKKENPCFVWNSTPQDELIKRKVQLQQNSTKSQKKGLLQERDDYVFFFKPQSTFSLLPSHIINYTHIKAEISTMSWFEGCTGRASVTLANIKCCKQSISEGDQRFTSRSNELSCRYNT